MNFSQIPECFVEYLPLAALLVSLGSLWISVVSLRRASRFQRYEYAPRLELVDELIQFSTPHGDRVHIASSGPGAQRSEVPTLITDPFSFAYKADIVNKGERTAEINRIYVDYGSSSDPDERTRRVVSGRSFLAPGDSLPLELILSPSDIEEAKTRHSVDECMFFLRVSYKTVEEPEVEILRGLGGYRPSGVSFVAHEGNVLG